MANSRFIQQGDYLSVQFINIDTLLDVLCKTQENLGEPLIFKEVSGRVEKLSKSNNDNDSEVNGCPKRQSALKAGDFSMTMRMGMVDDDDDGIYVCDYCQVLGYSKKYKPEICDSCKVCESCAEYDDDECSGCSYSIYRDGTFYRDKLSDEDLFSQEDLKIINSITVPSGKTHSERLPSEGGVFTVRKM